jgi:hypothetical protein
MAISIGSAGTGSSMPRWMRHSIWPNRLVAGSCGTWRIPRQTGVVRARCVSLSSNCSGLPLKRVLPTRPRSPGLGGLNAQESPIRYLFHIWSKRETVAHSLLQLPGRNTATSRRPSAYTNLDCRFAQLGSEANTHLCVGLASASAILQLIKLLVA